ncbi:polysaccharide pyruvyl transferase family protein [uncultured Pontibacter sp.]|uniref:polysaccharide pyruvyl transferase family protein n=1 Tax=uncultured Pontibacter sp. TaxID=453356 RepID=UPI00260919A9|nr:polysaccharide pyruvyl transferase family protein [uncultured Pontibacter sp.]
MEVNQPKKIGILTQPLHNNYGGLLQAYALQQTLKSFGYTVWIINRIYNRKKISKRIKAYLKMIFHGYLLNNKNYKLSILTAEQEQKVGMHTSYFKHKYIAPITPAIDTNAGMQQLNNDNFDAYVVGSDQVWRPKYSPNISNYFLDFIEGNNQVRKITYAASFGVSNWTFNKKHTERCARLAKKFHAVSVRESSGKILCKQHLGIEATQVLDPTLLLKPNDYYKLIQNENEPEVDGTLMTYVLDNDIDKEQLINEVANILNLKPFTVTQNKPLTIGNKKDLENCAYPPVTRWLRGVMDAKFVICDSFHGCAFSILFNKPFLALGNRKRGLARFESILKMFDLEERLITDTKHIDYNLLNKPIDWDRVNQVLANERANSLKFLQNELTPCSFGMANLHPSV